MNASFFGQPGRYGLGPPRLGRRARPPASIANRRVLANSSWPLAASADRDAVLRLPRFTPPSALGSYSSFVPTTTSGLPSPVMSPTAGVVMIAPWFQSAPIPLANVGAWVCGSTAVILERSITSTG